ncbi:hypothetical protein [Herminiimonas contaminans]|uniref:Uncharacterized protein n=1 Tax=Herminiimonas contaminans TaxID=1111140 RepID=A0ABS0ES30_9BURK|nr:hypothetical protein [Herminiimonas contaminans]MBF8177653.1 hypothetical protein [Herminiimonas contaminans]
MAKFEITAPDGSKHEITAPDNATEQDIMAYAQSQFSAPKQEATTRQKVQASIPGAIVQGMRDPIDAAAQMLPHGLRGLTSLGGLAPNRVSEFFDSEAKRVDSMNAEGERDYQSARTAVGKEGFDGGRLVGNVLSPANVAISARAPIAATTTLGRIGYGAGVGATGGLLTPVNDLKEGQSFFGTKAAQAGMGAATGAVLTPIMGKVGDVIARKFNSLQAASNPEIGARASLKTDELIKEALEEVGQKFSDIPEQQMNVLRGQVVDAMKQGKKLDPAAMLRQQDFNDLNIPATGGQISRDATQFARERNLRGVAGVGEPLMNRFEVQNQKLQSKVGSFGGNSSGEQFQAGQQLAEALKRTDDQLRGKVGDLYKEARASSGKDLNVPLTGLAQDYAETVRNFGDKIPSGVRNRMEELGLLSGQQKKVFSVEDAESVLKTINDNVSNDPATNKALDSLRNSVKNAVLSADDQGGVFAKARQAAAERFALQDAVPALKAASTGSTAPDDFVKRFVVSGKTKDVQGLAKLLQENDPAAFTEAKNQVGATLQRAAFGENTAGDKIFSPERYAKALRELGTEKLKAFYSPKEVAELQQVGRVGSYINSTPTAAPVNTSNTAGAVMNLMGNIPGMPYGTALVKTLKNAVDNQRVVKSGLAAQAPVGKADLTPEQIAMMVKLLTVGGATSGQAAATPLR